MRVLAASAFHHSDDPESRDLGHALELAFGDAGHEVEAIRIPFDRDRDALWPQLLAFRLTDVSDVGDLLVATAAPCHLLRHPCKVLWLAEHYPWIEDEGVEFQSLRTSDRQACAEAAGAFAISQSLCDRVARSSGWPVEPLAPPPDASWDTVIETFTARVSHATI